MNVEKIRKDWQARDFSCDIWTDPPGQRWEDYRHDVDELFLVLEGEVELEMKGKISHLKPGEEILIPANTLHSVRNLGKTTSRWLYGYKSSEQE
jgi:mannose-6-phosphate isomerase-like protein (cupin superfamily)